MAWSTKEKIISDAPSGKILTPDGYQVLVGTSENLVLIWKEAIDKWAQSTKQSSTWSQLPKQSSNWNLKAI
jgi:hypothetical protein